MPMSDATIESLEIKIESNVTKAVKSINALSKSLKNLKGSIKDSVEYGSKEIEKLGASLQKLKGVDKNGIDAVASSFEKLSVLNKIKVSSKASDQLKMISETLKSLKTSGIQTSGVLRDSLNSLKPVFKAAESLNFEKLSRQIYGVSLASDRLKKTNLKLSSSYAELASKVWFSHFALRQVARGISSWVTESNKYVENLNLFTASMGEYTERAQKYANVVADVMGIDPGEWMRNQGIFMTISEGFGIASERAYTMSKNLTQLGYDLSSFFNIPFEESMKKLTSGISGELEPLRRLGYDLSQARLKAIAFSFGIDKTFESMTQAEKAQLRYVAIMQQVNVAHGDMARTLNAPANQLRILKAQVEQLSRALGNVFIPILNTVLPYVIAFVKTMRFFADSIAEFLGFELPKIDYSGLENGTKAISDMGEEAENTQESLKKIKNALIGIDELNVISKDNKENGPQVGAGNSFDFKLPEYDFISKAITSKVDEIMNVLKQSLNEIEAVLASFELVIGTILVVSGTNIPIGIGMMAHGAWKMWDVVTTNWGVMPTRLREVLTNALRFSGITMLTIGAVLTFSGAKPSLGIALMIAGMTGIVTAVALNWGFTGSFVENSLDFIMNLLPPYFLAIGIMLVMSGAALPIGIALIVVGASREISKAVLSWGAVNSDIKSALNSLKSVVIGAELALGIILVMYGVSLPTGVALLIHGAYRIVQQVQINGGEIFKSLSGFFRGIMSIIAPMSLGLGVTLLMFGVNKPLAIGLIIAGLTGTVASAAVQNETVLNALAGFFRKIGIILGVSLSAVGAILVMAGVSIPLGIGLIVAGFGSASVGTSLNWGGVTKWVKAELHNIMKVVGWGLSGLGVILLLFGNITLGLSFIAAGAGALLSGKSLTPPSTRTIEHEVGRFIRQGDEAGQRWAKAFQNRVNNSISGLDTKIASKINNSSSYIKPVQTEVVIYSDTDKYWSKIQPKIDQKFKMLQPIILISDNSERWWPSFSKSLNLKFKQQQFKLEVRDDTKKWWPAFKNFVQSSFKSLQPNIPVQLKKIGWNKVHEWVGEVRTVSQPVTLKKNQWSSIAGWIGSIPSITQYIRLSKEGWNTISSFIGNIPSVSQKVKLVRDGWEAVNKWIGNIPVISQKVSLIREGWDSIQKWVGSEPAKVKVKLEKDYKSLSDFVGTSVSVKVNLEKGNFDSFKKFFGLSSGGYSTGHGFSLFKDGGFINSGNVGYWGDIPMYAGGGAGIHGTMFIAGEAGAEMVGHINGQTEVLNQSQIKIAMKAAVIDGMSQFTIYFRGIYTKIIEGANAVVAAIQNSTSEVNAAISKAGSIKTGQNFSPKEIQDATSFCNSVEYGRDVEKVLNIFFKDHLEQILKEIASDVKRQADKTQKTIVQIGNKVITDAVIAQRNANGFSFEG